jgi:hypothetical protein
MFVIAFACLVVIAKDTDAIHHQSQSILERMAAPGKGGWHVPYHHFDESDFRNRMSLVEHQRGIHVGNNNNRQ